jgi:hypothetical protein
MLKGESFLSRLNKPLDLLRNGLMVAFILSRYISIYSKLPSLNCKNCDVNPLRFEIFITHFVVVISRENACFRVGRVLEREFG